MATSDALAEIDQAIQQLSYDERLWLLERLVHGLRRTAKNGSVDPALAQMAADPETKRELAAIAEELAPSETTSELPSYDKLRELAKKYPPPEDWFNEDQKPF